MQTLCTVWFVLFEVRRILLSFWGSVIMVPVPMWPASDKNPGILSLKQTSPTENFTPGARVYCWGIKNILSTPLGDDFWKLMSDILQILLNALFSFIDPGSLYPFTVIKQPAIQEFFKSFCELQDLGSSPGVYPYRMWLQRGSIRELLVVIVQYLDYGGGYRNLHVW